MSEKFKLGDVFGSVEKQKRNLNEAHHGEEERVEGDQYPDQVIAKAEVREGTFPVPAEDQVDAVEGLPDHLAKKLEGRI